LTATWTSRQDLGQCRLDEYPNATSQAFLGKQAAQLQQLQKAEEQAKQANQDQAAQLQQLQNAEEQAKQEQAAQLQQAQEQAKQAKQEQAAQLQQAQEQVNVLQKQLQHAKKQVKVQDQVSTPQQAEKRAKNMALKKVNIGWGWWGNDVCAMDGIIKDEIRQMLCGTATSEPGTATIRPTAVHVVETLSNASVDNATTKPSSNETEGSNLTTVHGGVIGGAGYTHVGAVRDQSALVLQTSVHCLASKTYCRHNHFKRLTLASKTYCRHTHFQRLTYIFLMERFLKSSASAILIEEHLKSSAVVILIEKRLKAGATVECDPPSAFQDSNLTDPTPHDPIGHGAGPVVRERPGGTENEMHQEDWNSTKMIEDVLNIVLKGVLGLTFVGLAQG